MDVKVFDTISEMGRQAAEKGAVLIRDAIDARDEAFLILATGASQYSMLDALVERDDVDWSRCQVFHLDEYIGLDESHSASFVGYLKKRFQNRVPQLKQFVFIRGDAADVGAEISRINRMIGQVSIDVAFVGIGENGHLAFNDPPADFDTETPYINVQLDEACRQQQLGEGWFSTLEDVPLRAISMSIKQILKSKAIICTAPDSRKALAVKQTLEDPIVASCPASILQSHPSTWFFLDNHAASQLAVDGAG